MCDCSEHEALLKYSDRLGPRARVGGFVVSIKLGLFNRGSLSHVFCFFHHFKNDPGVLRFHSCRRCEILDFVVVLAACGLFQTDWI